MICMSKILVLSKYELGPDWMRAECPHARTAVVELLKRQNYRWKESTINLI